MRLSIIEESAILFIKTFIIQPYLMIIHTPALMEELGRDIAGKHKKVLLYGELAAGKTTFVRGFVEGLGLDPTQVSSPTYAYLQIYGNKVIHIDMYRLTQESELVEK
jgi:tRNA threonylcarbamoyl adenosine modification protein YjeE